jgi:hypothetical protein
MHSESGVAEVKSGLPYAVILTLWNKECVKIAPKSCFRFRIEIHCQKRVLICIYSAMIQGFKLFPGPASGEGRLTEQEMFGDNAPDGVQLGGVDSSTALNSLRYSLAIPRTTRALCCL